MHKKQNLSLCCLQVTHFRCKDIRSLKVKGWKKILHANRNQKTAEVAILSSGKIDFKHYLGVPKEEERQQGIKNLFEIMTENFPNSVKEKDTQVQESQRIPNKMTPRHIKRTKTHNNINHKSKKQRVNLKAARERQ